MIKVIALAVKPDNVSFDEYVNWILKIHAPMAKNYQGLRRYVVNIPIDEKSPYHSMSELWFDDVETFNKALETPQGQEIMADAQKNVAKAEILFAEEHSFV